MALFLYAYATKFHTCHLTNLCNAYAKHPVQQWETREHPAVHNLLNVWHWSKPDGEVCRGCRVYDGLNIPVIDIREGDYTNEDKGIAQKYSSIQKILSKELATWPLKRITGGRWLAFLSSYFSTSHPVSVYCWILGYWESILSQVNKNPPVIVIIETLIMYKSKYHTKTL